MLASLFHSTPRCVVLDINMDGLSGFDVRDALGRGGYRIPIIFVSADQVDWTAQHAFGEDVVACLRKPVDDVVLLEAASTALRRTNFAVGRYAK